MSAGTLKLEIPRDFQEFAEELVRRGKAASVEAVVYDTLAARREAAFDEAIEEGYRAADEGRVSSWDLNQSMDAVLRRHGVSTK